jgi:hypothetical protein
VNRFVAVLFISLFCRLCNATVITCETDQSVGLGPPYNDSVENMQGYSFMNLQLKDTPAIRRSNGNYCASTPAYGNAETEFFMWQSASNWRAEPLAHSGTFDLHSFDLAKQVVGDPDAATYTIWVEGFLPGGSLKQKFIQMPAGSPLFNTIYFFGWTGLDELAVYGYFTYTEYPVTGAAPFAIDNIHLIADANTAAATSADAIPEPHSLRILLLGALLAVAVKYKQAFGRRHNEQAI